MNPDVLIATTLAPLVMLIIQAVKAFFPNIGKKAIPLNIFLSMAAASILVNWDALLQVAVLELATYTLGIAGIAAGVYSSVDRKKTVDILPPDILD